MSAVIGTNAKSNGDSKGLTAGSATNPFNTPFDDDDSDSDAYEWWEDAESTPPKNQKLHENIGGSNGRSLNRSTTRKVEKKYSVHKPIRHKSRGRQRKQNAQAGIKLVTDFSARQNPTPAQLPAQKPNAQGGCFVDLAALEALNGGPKPKSKTGGFWKTLKNKPADVSAQNPVPTEAALAPRPHDPYVDLSPSDRPIFIGLSIPSRDVSMHQPSPQTASSETSNIVQSYQHRTPIIETPTIIITPANEGSTWSPFDEGSMYNGQKHSATSSFYSQVSTEHNTAAAPPVPKVPNNILREEQQRIAAQKSCFSPDTEDGTTWEDESVRSRVVSSCTIFEEDVSPIVVRTGRGVSVSDGSKPGRRASVGTTATPATPRRYSKGWWNYITTPFLTRSNTFATNDPSNQQPPALPNLAIAAAKAEYERDGKTWEKQFSPLTPATTTTIQSDTWWNADPKSAVQSPVDSKLGHKTQVSAVTVPFVFSGDAPVSPLDPESPVPSLPSSRLDTSDREVPVSPIENNMRGLQSNNPFGRPQSSDTNESSISSRRQVIQPAPVVVMQQQPQTLIVNNINHVHQSPSNTPPPAYSPPPSHVPRYRAVFPPGHALNMEQPMSPGPLTPGMQNAMAGPGAVQMDNVPLTPARSTINLNSSYPALPPRGNAPIIAAYLPPPTKHAKKAEAKRRRHEKEEAVARRAGGWWRGRGCVPKRGCYGRGGAEGRKKRRCYIGIIIGFLLVIILAVVLATQLRRKPSSGIEASQWVNLTGFPPIFAGLSTIVAPVNTVENTGCVFPATQWSCSLPKELQSSVAPNQPNQPNFLLNIQWDNSTETNATFANVTGNPTLPIRAVGGNAVSAGQFVRRMLLRAKRAISIVPSPAPPSFADGFFLGNTTDGIVSDQKAGEPTPFYISLLQPEKSNFTKRALATRQSNTSDPFPDLDTIIPAPSSDSDGTAAPANLLPFPTQQPIRLYDRGLPTEHYGFYTYYDRSIFLKSIDLLNSTNDLNGEVPADLNGGATKNEAQFRCTWTQTRLLVQIWTRRNTTAQLLNSSTHNPVDPAHDYAQPGSFPYPVTVTVDRHGGDARTKMVYCYKIDERGRNVVGSGKIMQEQRFFGGSLVNPANVLFGSEVADPGLGGFDGGDGGCKCKWDNFVGRG
ncbi:hypothetical protein HYFRA_00011382 [Hymenoscyphus fraxineus]|uniref:Glycoprotease family protein n=1 Tax=Hymenoscyphus fraxineus TaxID=746836 RepID=A0A9N9L0B9_9HELO|nr:hypothetical protein HYFRA_00011382 [Hymenoscyphus fraxineus]